MCARTQVEGVVGVVLCGAEGVVGGVSGAARWCVGCEGALGGVVSGWRWVAGGWRAVGSFHTQHCECVRINKKPDIGSLAGKTDLGSRWLEKQRSCFLDAASKSSILLHMIRCEEC